MEEDENDSRSYLLQFAPLIFFWILRTQHVQPGLIHYLGSDGIAYALMDDDGERVEKCLEFLEGMGCAIFNDVTEMDCFVAQLTAVPGASRRSWPGGE